MKISKLLIINILSVLITALLYSCSDNNEPEILPDDDSEGYIYTGNVRLSAYVNQVEEELDKVIVFHQQTNSKRDFVYNVYFSDAFTDENKLRRYQNCRFDKLTGWSELCKILLDKDLEKNKTN